MIIFQFLNSKNGLYILSFQLNGLEYSNGARLSHLMFSDYSLVPVLGLNIGMLTSRPTSRFLHVVNVPSFLPSSSLSSVCNHSTNLDPNFIFFQAALFVVIWVISWKYTFSKFWVDPIFNTVFFKLLTIVLNPTGVHDLPFLVYYVFII